MAQQKPEVIRRFKVSKMGASWYVYTTSPKHWDNRWFPMNSYDRHQDALDAAFKYSDMFNTVLRNVRPKES